VFCHRALPAPVVPAAVLAVAAEHSHRAHKSRDSPSIHGRYVRPPGLQFLLLSPLLSVGSPQINGRCRGSPTPPSTEGVKDLLPLYSAIPVIRGRHQRPPTHAIDGRCPRFHPIAPSSPSALPPPSSPRRRWRAQIQGGRGSAPPSSATF
jgi:hypothetical protein